MPKPSQHKRASVKAPRRDSLDILTAQAVVAARAQLGRRASADEVDERASIITLFITGYLICPSREYH